MKILFCKFPIAVYNDICLVHQDCLCDVGLRMFLLIVIFFVTPVNLRKGLNCMPPLTLLTCDISCYSFDECLS
jgi:hypothetical protein